MRHCTQCGAATPDDARFCPRCGAPVAAAGGSDPMLGKVIADRYLLVEKVGQGGSGTIYRGEHTTLRKRVAVKVLHAQLSTDDTALERFRREATTVAELDNDHILQVLDFGRTEDNRLFFAMEHLEGETLTKVIEREKTLPTERAVDILGQIAEALTDAHGLGYVHRDLRPRNIFLTNKRGRADFVKLLDFGLAKLILPNVEAKQTAMGMTFGDPRYMSPEQARGESLDRRSDIYSLGAIAFEMLTGNPPYTGSGTFEILQQHLDAPVPRVRDTRPDCPEWLDSVVQRALAKQPDGRYSTVSKLLESLKGQQPPAAADPVEQAAHAKLSSERPPQPTAPGPVQSMGPAAAVEQLPPKPGSPRDTLALTTLGPKNGPQAAAKAQANKKEKEKNNGGAPGGPAATSGSVEVVRAPLKAPEAANVPSVVVESSSQEKTMPAKIPLVEAAPPAPAERPTVERPTAPPPTPATETSHRRQKDPTGEWFSSDSQPIRVVPGATYDEDLDELPKKHKGPVIIAGVTGGLIFVGIVVIALLPKPQHKPLRGEEAAKTAQTEPAKAPPPPATVQPSGGGAGPSGAAVQPSGTSAAAGVSSGGTAAPSGATGNPSAMATGPSGAAAARTEVIAPSGGSVMPSGTVAAPSGAGHGVGTQASGAVAAAPALAAHPTGAPMKPETASPPAKPAAVAVTPAAKPAMAPVAPAKPAVIAAAPAAKPAVAAVAPVAKGPSAVVAKNTVASEKGGSPPGREAKEPKVDKARVAVAAVDKAPAEKRKKEKAPEAFKDPFASDAPKASAPSASESAQAEFFVKLGRQKLNAGDVGGAATNFNKAREYDARSADAVAGIGEVAFEQGDYAGAAVHLKQALRLSPNRSRYLVLLGQAYYKLGKPKDAVGEYKKALRIDPNNQEAQHSLEVAERKLQSGG